MAALDFHRRETPSVNMKKFLYTNLGAVYLSIEDVDLTIFYDNEAGFINFKNQVLWAYEEYLRNKRSSG